MSSPRPLTEQVLLRELESLAHDARMRRMVEVGRQSVRDRAAAATLTALEAGGFYERLLALQAAHGSRDAAVSVRLLAGPSRLLRGRAHQVLALLGDDKQLRTALRASRGCDRLSLLKRLLRRGRWKPIDAFLSDLAGRNDPDLGPLLPLGSERVVGDHLDQARSRGGVIFWRRLGRYHPAVALRLLRADAAGEDTPPARLALLANEVLPRAGDLVPDEALAAVRVLARRVPLERLALVPLLRRRPEGVADLVLRSDGPSSVPLGSVAGRLNSRRLLALLRHRPAALGNP
ncbi:MAG TPA: hypothetical protein VFW33_21110, partial [Gemmataceae bacterium]|nr:hypothetical protein [Gemmataceae bacterium]